MGRLIYSAMVSLDGYIEDANGEIGWSAPEEGLHQLANDNVKSLDGVIMGRRLYETMVPVWHDLLTTGEWFGGTAEDFEMEFAQIWAETPKYVASRSLTEVHESCELIEGDAVEWILHKKEETDGDIEVGGAELAAAVEAAGGIDVYRLMLQPVIVGGGKRFLSEGKLRDLELTDLKRFPGGSLALEYAVKS